MRVFSVFNREITAAHRPNGDLGTAADVKKDTGERVCGVSILLCQKKQRRLKDRLS